MYIWEVKELLNNFKDTDVFIPDIRIISADVVGRITVDKDKFVIVPSPENSHIAILTLDSVLKDKTSH